MVVNGINVLNRKKFNSWELHIVYCDEFDTCVIVDFIYGIYDWETSEVYEDYDEALENFESYV